MSSIKSRVARWLTEIWYNDEKNPPATLVRLSTLYTAVIRLRRYLYSQGIFQSTKPNVPVIVIGNLTVGGTGKTPLTIWLAHYLKNNGETPGIVSRGYGGQTKDRSMKVTNDSDFREVGDEAIVLARRSQCPVFVGQNRARTATMLQQAHSCSVILSDDGLQHYGMARDIEIVVVDGERQFGNGYCLPAGPLREPLNRLQEADLVIYNGRVVDNDHSMGIDFDTAVNLRDESRTKALADFENQSVHVISGIGNPQRFHNLLSKKKILFDSRQFPDHHIYNKPDIQFADDKPVMMTEKDAVKCRSFAGENHWYIPAHAEVDTTFAENLLTLLSSRPRNGQ